MKTLEKYIKIKLNNKKFKKAYDDECNICDLTVKIIAKIHAGKKKYAEIARETNMSVDELEELASGDKCIPEKTLKLCEYLKIKGPICKKCF